MGNVQIESLTGQSSIFKNQSKIKSFLSTITQKIGLGDRACARIPMCARMPTWVGGMSVSVWYVCVCVCQNGCVCARLCVCEIEKKKKRKRESGRLFIKIASENFAFNILLSFKATQAYQGSPTSLLQLMFKSQGRGKKVLRKKKIFLN